MPERRLPCGRRCARGATRLILIGLLGTGTAAPLPALAVTSSELHYTLTLRAGETHADGWIDLRQRDGTFSKIRLDRTFLSHVKADGQIEEDGMTLHWSPPARGGALRYSVLLDRDRNGHNGSSKRSAVTPRWALLRADHAFPVRGWTRKTQTPYTATLRVRTPSGWRQVTPYGPPDGTDYTIRNPGTRLGRPLGWVIAGDIATREDTIGGVDISISAPRGEQLPRIPMLALLRWTLPTLAPIAGRLPDRVNIVSAGEPMWRGALSAPNSIYIHVARPLISQNATSTLLHEMLHVMLFDLDTAHDEDWIDEGLAEYLSLKALKRSGTIPEALFQESIATFRKRSAATLDLRGTSVCCEVTARAVTIFHDLDEEIARETQRSADILTLVRRLLDDGRPVDGPVLRNAAATLLGRPSKVLANQPLPRQPPP